MLNENQGQNFIEDALQLGTEEAYRTLLSPIRFDYMSMKDENTGSYSHYHRDMISSNAGTNPKKMLRLAQELADLSNALPNNDTNAIFVRVDSERVDVMKAIITGSN